MGERPELKHARDALKRHSATIARCEGVRAKLLEYIKVHGEEAARANFRGRGGDAEAFDEVLSGKFIADLSSMDDKVADLERQIVECERLEALSRPVDTVVPMLHGKRDYKMLVDEANDAKIDAIMVTAATAYEVDTKIPTKPGESSMSDWVKSAITVIPNTETFVWGPDIVKIVKSTADRVPDDFRVFAERFVIPSPQWWWWGEAGARLGMLFNPDGKSPDLAITGMMIVPGAEVSIINDNPVTYEPAVGIYPLVKAARGVAIMVPSFWLYSKTVSEMEKSVVHGMARSSNNESILRLTAACLSWMTQKVVTHVVHPPGRQTRKRTEAKGIVNRTIVVQLRRTESKPSGQPGKEIEHDHRWMVREHYRNQWYSSTGRHERILIAAFIKGPDDKPLIVKDRVFVVNR